MPDPLITVPGQDIARNHPRLRDRYGDGSHRRARPAGLDIVEMISASRAAREAERLRRSEDHLARAQRIAHTGSIEQDLRTGAIEWFGETYLIFGLDPNSPAPVG